MNPKPNRGMFLTSAGNPPARATAPIPQVVRAPVVRPQNAHPREPGCRHPAVPPGMRVAARQNPFSGAPGRPRPGERGLPNARHGPGASPPGCAPPSSANSAPAGIPGAPGSGGQILSCVVAALPPRLPEDPQVDAATATDFRRAVIASPENRLARRVTRGPPFKAIGCARSGRPPGRDLPEGATARAARPDRGRLRPWEARTPCSRESPCR